MFKQAMNRKLVSYADVWDNEDSFERVEEMGRRKRLATSKEDSYHCGANNNNGAVVEHAEMAEMEKVRNRKERTKKHKHRREDKKPVEEEEVDEEDDDDDDDDDSRVLFDRQRGLWFDRLSGFHFDTESNLYYLFHDRYNRDSNNNGNGKHCDDRHTCYHWNGEIQQYWTVAESDRQQQVTIKTDVHIDGTYDYCQKIAESHEEGALDATRARADEMVKPQLQQTFPFQLH